MTFMTCWWFSARFLHINPRFTLSIEYNFIYSYRTDVKLVKVKVTWIGRWWCRISVSSNHCLIMMSTNINPVVQAYAASYFYSQFNVCSYSYEYRGEME